jgi:hypothetical protein
MDQLTLLAPAATGPYNRALITQGQGHSLLHLMGAGVTPATCSIHTTDDVALRQTADHDVRAFDHRRIGDWEATPAGWRATIRPA